MTDEEAATFLNASMSDPKNRESIERAMKAFCDRRWDVDLPEKERERVRGWEHDVFGFMREIDRFLGAINIRDMMEARDRIAMMLIGASEARMQLMLAHDRVARAPAPISIILDGKP